MIADSSNGTVVTPRIGVELECFIVHQGSLKEITRVESQSVFSTLINDYGWTIFKYGANQEVHSVSKQIAGYKTIIKYDVSYTIFEIATLKPCKSLDELEQVNKESLSEFMEVLNVYNFKIWPESIAPASSGLLNLPFKTTEDIIDDFFYTPLRRIEYLERLCHITSHQVNVDVPISKLIPAINVLYKSLGEIIRRFSRSPLKINGKEYYAGRYYFWNDCRPELNSKRYNHGIKPIFPEREFKNLDDYYRWIWEGEFAFVIRDGELYTFEDKTMSVSRFLEEKKSIVIGREEKKREIILEVSDIDNFLFIGWPDFKPHIRLDGTQTLEEFLESWQNKTLDQFLEKHCRDSWIEIRPCAPHLEENAMVLPRYFYEVILNVEGYIAKSKNISWDEAKQARDKAIS